MVFLCQKLIKPRWLASQHLHAIQEHETADPVAPHREKSHRTNPGTEKRNRETGESIQENKLFYLINPFLPGVLSPRELLAWQREGVRNREALNGERPANRDQVPPFSGNWEKRKQE
ncbi:hypothetical protein CDAR_105601 [Caerostris darwini]|uniref:Uncharacterized protein n=1 Tax=Caerostris darwini TaxID=1538125 RepID=A0AAV4V0I8_9ARAC|nr:hypothetical protein CDAR_105601 [Caerostris darwini]